MFDILGLTIGLALIYFIILNALLALIFKCKKTYPYIIAGAISLALSVQQFPTVKKSTDKVLTYEAIKVAINFDHNLTKQEIHRNVKSLVRHFKGHEKAYQAVISYPKGKYHQRSYGTVLVSGQKMPHYWKWENQTLLLYLSTPLNNKEFLTFQNILYKKFFNLTGVPSSLKIKSVKKSFFLSLLLKDFDLKGKREVQLVKDYIAHGIVKVGREKITERKAVCSISFKLQEDYWNTLFQETQKGYFFLGSRLGLSKDANIETVRKTFYTQLQSAELKVELNGKEYKAFIFIDTKMQQYVGIELENYVEKHIEKDENKPSIVVDVAFKEPYEDIEKDCQFSQLQKFPYLEKMVIEKNFLKDFQGVPISLSLERVQFSPLYNKTEEID